MLSQKGFLGIILAIIGVIITAGSAGGYYLINNRTQQNVRNDLAVRRDFPQESVMLPPASSAPEQDDDLMGWMPMKLCDIVPSGKCDQEDLDKFNRALGAVIGDVNYNSLADIDSDGKVTLSDKERLFPDISEPNSSGMSKYVAKDGKFSFSYPNNFELRPEFNVSTANIDAFGLYTKGWTPQTLGLADTYSIYIIHYLSDFDTPEDFMSRDLKKAGKIPKATYKESNINGNYVIIKQYDDSEELPWRSGKNYYFYRKDIAVLFLGEGISSKWLDQTAATFKFID